MPFNSLVLLKFLISRYLPFALFLLLFFYSFKEGLARTIGLTLSLRLEGLLGPRVLVDINIFCEVLRVF